MNCCCSAAATVPKVKQTTTNVVGALLGFVPFVLRLHCMSGGRVMGDREGLGGKTPTQPNNVFEPPPPIKWKEGKTRLMGNTV